MMNPVDTLAASAAEASGVYTSGGLVRPHYQPLLQRLRRFSWQGLKQRQQRLDRAAMELGMHFSAFDPCEDAAEAPFSRLDLFPHIIPNDTWRVLSAGVLQRARAFNAYVHDVYHDQRILADRILPYPLVLGDPAFHRTFSRIHMPGKIPSLCGAFDLLPDDGGTWSVVEHHMATPTGLSLILQNRRSLAQVFPEIFDACDITPVAAFATRLAEAIRELSPQSSPGIVLLSSGGSGQSHFEESFLARQFGVPLVRSADLLVRDGRVHVKTIRGLEPVDIIWRCIRGDALDPIAQPGCQGVGTPGLINIARQGRVLIVNAPGCGIADNRAVLRYADHIIRYYLNESPILKTVPTWYLGDADQAECAFSQPGDWVFKPIHNRARMPSETGSVTTGEDPLSTRAQAQQTPEHFAAQARQNVARLPVFENKGYQVHPYRMRLFYLLGSQPTVLPGGLAMGCTSDGHAQPAPAGTEWVKDTWIPATGGMDQDLAGMEAKPSPSTVAAESISSRIAEALYWGGRYLERAENTARQLNILENVRWDQMNRIERLSYWPLWKAVAEATGKNSGDFGKRPRKDTLRLSTTLMMDDAEAASVAACVRTARHGLESVREALSPEMWQVLSGLHLFMNRQGNQRRLTRTQLREICGKVVMEIACLNGTMERTLSHDDRWCFYRVGIMLERSIATLTILINTLTHAADRQQHALGSDEETNLTALLRLLCSLDAYNKAYRSRARWNRVIHLLLCDHDNPTSVSFCLNHMDRAFMSIHRRAPLPAADSLRAGIEGIRRKLDGGGMDALDPSTEGYGPNTGETGLSARKFLLDILADLQKLHAHIEDPLFSHQA